jgi:hypothetical protein
MKSEMALFYECTLKCALKLLAPPTLSESDVTTTPISNLAIFV